MRQIQISTIMPCALVSNLLWSGARSCLGVEWVVSLVSNAHAAIDNGENMPKPKFNKLSVRLPEDVTAEGALSVLTEEKSGKISPDTREVYEEIVHNLELPKEVENPTQKVFEGQLLVLGDSRVGKTSLVKALTGQRFDHGEKKTHGVETKVVDRKWKVQELTELIFGRFSQFSEGRKEESALLPRIFNRFKYRYGGSHCAENSDKEPILWEKFFLEKSGLSAIIGDFLAAYLLLIWVVMAVLGTLFGRAASGLFLLVLRVLWDIFQAVTNGIGVKHQLFLYWGLIIGSVSAEWCLTKYEFGVPLSERKKFPWMECRGALLRELYISIVDIFFSMVACAISAVLHQALCYISSAVYNSTQTWIDLLIDNVMDIRNSLDDMLFLILVTFVRICLFPGYVFTNISIPVLLLGVMVFHLVYLHHQKLLWNRKGMTVLLLELILGFSCFFFNSYLLGSMCVLVVMFSLHGYGKWLQIREFFPGKSFVDVLFKGNFAIHVIVVQKALKNRKKLQAALDQVFSSLRYRILDFAGDKEYYVYHHMFMRKEALYVIAFSIRDFVQDNFQHREQKLQRLWFWLQSVCGHVNPRTPIFLVGTHRGKIKDETLDTLNGHLRQSLWSLFSDHLVTCKFKGRHLLYFPVENSKGSNDFHGICKLRSAITRIAHEKRCKTNLCREVPHSWIKVQDAIIKMRTSSSQKLCWAVEELKEHMKDICNTDDLQNVLEYFHAKGLVIYISGHPVLSKWVLLNPELLVKIIVKLVNILPEDRQKRGSRQHWNLLRNTGRLSKSLLHNILSKAAGGEEEPVRKLLEEYDLICLLSVAAMDTPWGDNIPATHFVPSLLPTANKPPWYDHPDDVQCYVKFKKFLPEPLFHRLLSRCCKHSQAMNGIDEPHLYCDCGLFWLGPGKPYHLKLLKEECMIEVTFNR